MENPGDFYSDQGALLGRLFSSSDEMPDSLKLGEYPMDPDDLSELPSTSFADPESRSFLVSNPACTLASFAYLKVAGVDDSDPRMERVKTASSLFRIEHEILKMAEIIAARMRKDGERKTASASPETTYWRIDEVHEGKIASLEGSCEADLRRHMSELTERSTVVETSAPLVRKVARSLVRVAAETGVPEDTLPEDILKLAGLGYPDPAAMEAGIMARAIVLPLEERGAFHSKVAALWKGTEKRAEDLPGLVDAIDLFDRRHGLQKYYGVRFEDPLRTVHGIVHSKAAALVSTVEIAGDRYLGADLDSEEARKVALHVMGDDLYGESFQDGFCPSKLASVLDGKLAHAFKRLLSLEGIDPA